MGSPLAPTFANLFLCHHEKLWLDNCPSEFKPVLYRRYVDDTFLLFTRPHHVQLFLNYLNSQHPNIEFTAEIRENSKLSLLDVTVCKDHGMFVTSVYRKSTFTGLGMKFTSFVPRAFKNNLISCLIIRAFKICSSSFSFNLELSFLKEHFLKNSFPPKLLDNTFKKVIHNVYNSGVPFHSAAKKKANLFLFSISWLPI